MASQSLYTKLNPCARSAVLPNHNLSSYNAPVNVPKRFMRVALGAVMIISLAMVLYIYRPGLAGSYKNMPTTSDAARLPPLYKEYSAAEEQLPQHDLTLPFPEGRHAKYIWFSNHVRNVGWGNHMQELVMNAHLAYVTKRAYVFDNYTWDRDGPEYSTFNGKVIPSRIPLSAMISGPVIGSFSPGDGVPRAVSKNFFYKVCPNATIIDSAEVNEHLRMDENVGVSYIFSKWVEKLNSIEDPCVQIAPESYGIFEFWLFGSRRILDIWDSLRKSPIVTTFNWSSLVRSAFITNTHHFQPPSLPPVTGTDLNESLPGLIALHIRRGDFLNHCYNFANWSSRWNGFNNFPSLPDQFEPPEGGGWGINTPKNYDIYLKHCLPTIEQIIAKVADIRKVSSGLNSVYILTNADRSWLKELKVALRRLHSWDKIASNRDLDLSWEQQYVGQMVDMMIAERAQIFVGNGFSSLSSNIIMLRMAKDHGPETNRLW